MLNTVQKMLNTVQKMLNTVQKMPDSGVQTKMLLLMLDIVHKIPFGVSWIVISRLRRQLDGGQSMLS